MKNFLFVFAFMILFLQDAQGEDYMGNQTLKGETLKDANFLGGATLTDVKAKSLSIVGTLQFHNLTVQGDTDIIGPITKSDKGTFGDLAILGTFEAKNITCKQLDVTGFVSATGLTVDGETSIVGSLTLKASKDPKMTPNKLQNLNITAEKISLENTDVEGNIMVKKAVDWLGRAKKQVLQLKGKTTVKGTITFESGTGKIEQDPDVKVRGTVTGATVKTK